MLIFSTFKAEDHRVRNALYSWKEAGADILLQGKETLPTASAWETGWVEVQRSEWGMPLVNSMIAMAYKCEANSYALVNADIMLIQGIKEAAAWARKRYGERYLIVGQRTNMMVARDWGFIPHWQNQFIQLAKGQKKLPPCGSDYFIFGAETYEELPDLAIARYTWDNYLIWDCLARKVPVIDATDVLLAVHQNHFEDPLLRTSKEAQANRRIAQAARPEWNEWKGWVSQATYKLREEDL